MKKYQAVYTTIKAQIESGELAPGTALPSEKRLAERHSVSVLTVRKALSLLEDEGLINRRQGRGSFVETAVSAGDGRGLIVVLRVIKNIGHFGPTFAGRSHSSLYRNLLDLIWRGGHKVSICDISANELAQGHFPLIFDRARPACVLLTGFFEDVHILRLQERGLPVLAYGNRPINIPVPHLDFDFEKLACDVTLALSNGGRLPVKLLSRNFDIYFSFEIMSGYLTACSTLGIGPEIELLLHPPESVLQLRNILVKSSPPFALLVNHPEARCLYDLYGEFGLSRRENPYFATCGADDFDRGDLKENDFFMGNYQEAEILSDLVNRMVNGEDIGKVRMEAEVNISSDKGYTSIDTSWYKKNLTR